MMLLAVQLLLAHVLSEFVLQPKTWLKDQKQNKLRSMAVYKHMAVVSAVLVCCLAFDFSYWRSMLFIILSHYVIDATYLATAPNYAKPKRKNWFFAAKQLAHLVVLFMVWQQFQTASLLWNKDNFGQLLLLLLCFILLTRVSSVIIKKLLSNWQFAELTQEESLRNAGKYIGMLERLLVFAFIVLHQWGAVGFLIAAKSILRFSDLSRAKDRKLTEYILLGTLLSFGIAIVAGILFVWVKKRLHP